MYTIFRQLVLIVGISLMPWSIAADTAYAVARLDSASIELKKEQFDRKYARLTYVRYGGLVAIAASLAYLGYTKCIAPKNVEYTAQTLAQAYETLQKDYDVLTGKSLLKWGSDLMNHVLLGINLNTIGKVIAAPIVGRALTPLLELDAFWYEIRAEGDYAKSIIVKANRLASQRVLDPITDAEKELIYASIKDSALLLKNQIEKIIGYLRHKQGRYREQKAEIVLQIDNQIHYMLLIYDDFAQILQELLNEKNITAEDQAAEILACTQKFADEYVIVKDHFKALDDALYQDQI